MQRDPSEMTPAQLRRLRISLGLSISELAVVLGLDARTAPADATEPALARSVREAKPLYYQTVSRWEWGIKPISLVNVEAFRRLIRYTDDTVQAIIAAHVSGKPILTYVDDEAFHRAEPGFWPSLTAYWHLMAAGRAEDEIPGAVIRYRGHD